MESTVATLAILTNCIQFCPQLYKIYTTKHVKDLSIYSLVLIVSTNLLWLTHGYFILDMALLVSSSISLFVNLMIVYLYLKYR
jgi:MtN3 and saliva related transmembrane protein